MIHVGLKFSNIDGTGILKLFILKLTELHCKF